MVTRLKEADFIRAADMIGCSVPAIKAIAEVESAGDGFDKEGRIKILFERHKFHKFTNGKYSLQHPDISNSVPGGYTFDEYKRFNKAYSLDKEAAMKSCSWGSFQVMGYHYALCGYESVDEFVDAQKTVLGQLLTVVKFINSNPQLRKALVEENWKEVALRYNGAGYKKNQYDEKLLTAYNKHKQLTKLFNACIQGYLNSLGFSCGVADGVVGEKTRDAIKKFEKHNGLEVSGKIREELINATKCG